MTPEDEEKVEELWRKIQDLKAPKAPNDWVPVDLYGNFVVASKKINEDRIIIWNFRKDGIWKRIWDYFKKRNDLFDEMGKILRKYPEFDVIAF